MLDKRQQMARDTSEEEILFGFEVNVESRPPHVRAVGDVLDGERAIVPLVDQFSDRFLQTASCSTDPSVQFTGVRFHGSLRFKTPKVEVSRIRRITPLVDCGRAGAFPRFWTLIRNRTHVQERLEGHLKLGLRTMLFPRGASPRSAK
jgi:hypothetical protein